MKYLLFFLLLFPAIACGGTFVETTLDTPETFTPVAKYKIRGIWLTDEAVKVFYDKLDGSGNLIEKVGCTIGGSDFTAFSTSTIPAGAVGDVYFQKLGQGVSNICKGANYLNISGTDS